MKKLTLKLNDRTPETLSMQVRFSGVVDRLQTIGGLKWADMEDPHGVARDLRG